MNTGVFSQYFLFNSPFFNTNIKHRGIICQSCEKSECVHLEISGLQNLIKTEYEFSKHRNVCSRSDIRISNNLY